MWHYFLSLRSERIDVWTRRVVTSCSMFVLQAHSASCVAVRLGADTTHPGPQNDRYDDTLDLSQRTDDTDLALSSDDTVTSEHLPVTGKCKVVYVLRVLSNIAFMHFAEKCDNRTNSL